MGDNELSKRWKHPKKRTTPVLERILVRNFNGSCAEIQRSPAESAQADLEDALTRYGGCLIKQLREESFLPENGVFRMNDIVEVGGAELKLSDGNRFLPSTQIRFLGSYFPAIIIKVVTADRYRKGLEETRRAMLTMLGKIRVAIVIKIERSPPRAAEASGTSTNNTNAKSTTTPEDERLSMNDRITVKLLQLFHTSGGQLVALHISKEEVFPKVPDDMPSQLFIQHKIRSFLPFTNASVSSLSLQPLKASKYLQLPTTLCYNRPLCTIASAHKCYSPPPLLVEDHAQ